MGQILLTLSLAPVLALIVLFYHVDRYEPEPRKVVLKVFAFGTLTVIPAGILECLYTFVIPKAHEPGNLCLLFIHIFFSIALVEEFCKFMVVMTGIYRSPEFDEPFDGIVYSVAASLGFAALENIMYVFTGGIGTGIMRAIMSVPGHALFGALMGYCIGRAKFSKPRKAVPLILAGLFWATMAHCLYDFFLLSQNVGLILCVFPFLAGLWAVVILLARQLQRESPFKFNPQKESAPPARDFRCPGCGYSMPDNSRFCLQCGLERSPGEVALAEKAPLLPGPGGILLCPSCGFHVEESARFCRQCGHRVEKMPLGPVSREGEKMNPEKE